MDNVLNSHILYVYYKFAPERKRKENKVRNWNMISLVAFMNGCNSTKIYEEHAKTIFGDDNLSIFDFQWGYEYRTRLVYKLSEVVR